MDLIEIRPRFEASLSLPPEEAIQRIKLALEQPETGVRGVIVDHHITLSIPLEQQHYWSPQLSLTIEDVEEATILRGLFGPRPSVWLMFTFLYSVIGAISLFVAITGFSQLSLGMAAPALWTLPVAAVLALILYFSAKTGERLGKEEMYLLKNFLAKALVNNFQTTNEDGKTTKYTGT